MYLNTAATGLVPKSTISLVENMYQELSAQGATATEKWVVEMNNIKKKVAQMINADVSEIAIVPNMATGQNFLAQMFSPLKSIGYIQGDFPSLYSPWEIQGFENQVVKEKCNGKFKYKNLRKLNTDILAISHVQWHTGFKINPKKVSKITRENNQIFMLDATQSLGTCKIDVEEMGIDIMMVSCYKWMMAGFGNCIMYIKKELLEKYPSSHCWQFRAPIKYGVFKDARRFEIGHERHDDVFRLGNGIDLIQSIGISRIEKRIKSLTDYLYTQLKKNKIKIISDYPSKYRSQICIIDGSEKLQKKLEEKGIMTSHRGTGIRVAIHIYNNKRDIDELVHYLKQSD